MDTHTNSTPTPRGEVGRARANIQALRVLTTLQEEQRTPTQQERDTLAHWSGWGPLAKALGSHRSGTWAEIGEELTELLTPAQLRQGLEACTSSFYTPPEVMDACWQILTGLGFSSGSVLEPGCGSGNFLSATPQNVQARWLGVESDDVSANIARHLHPEAMIMHRPMEAANLPPFSRDAVIGNVPFSEVGVFDPAAPAAVTNTLHDYMIWSSVQALAPGGIAVLVTSCGTLEKIDSQARFALDAEAALIGAIRLPSGTFDSRGTNAPADILILRRRTGEEPLYDPSKPPAAELPQDKLLATVAAGTWTRVSEGHNAYFGAFPEMALGTIGRHPVYSGQVEVTPDPDRPWQQALPEAATTVVERAKAVDLGWAALQAPGELTVSSTAADLGLYEGQILAVERPGENGTPRQVIAQVVAGEIEEVRTDKGNLKPANAELLALIELRDAARELFEADADTQHVSDDELAVIRERTLDLYQAYTDRFGPIGRVEVSHQNRKDKDGNSREVRVEKTPSLGGIRADTEFATLLAVEDYDLDTDTAKPADILQRRVHAVVAEPNRADTPAEAVALSLNAHNHVATGYIAYLLGVDLLLVPELLAAEHAAFTDPRDPAGQMVPAATYLSGNIAHKLEQAREAAEADPRFVPNVQALEAAAPAVVPAEKIDARLGAPWIPPRVVEQFAREVLEVRVDVSYYRATGDWIVKVDDWFPDSKESAANSEQWAFTPPRPGPGQEMPNLVGWDPKGGRPLRYGHQLLEKALNNGTPTITQEIEDKRLEHPKFTRAAAKVKERIERAFASWVWQDSERAQELAAAFNRDFASTRPPAYRGSALTFPGISKTVDPHPHQVDFVARALATEPGTGVINAHVMGGGKTITMFLSAIKHVQLGLATNPIIVVPNGLLADITREGKQLFPGARILMATNDDLAGPEARRRFAYKCVANQWDAIVMTASLFERIPIDAKSEAGFHAEHKANLAATFAADAKDARGAHAKRVSKKIKARERRAKELLAKGPSDTETLAWSRVMGSKPMVLVDEASDVMRNLGEFVQAEGISMSSPAKGADAFAKARLVQGAGGKVMLFTGTPYVRNAIDLYTLMFIVDPKRLERHGIFSGDDFARMFLRFETVLEPTANGAGVNLRTRVRSLINKEQMQALFAEFADRKSDKDLNLDLPEMEQITHKVEASPALRELADDLALRETLIKGWQTEKGDDTYLSLVATGRAAALDPVLAGLPEDGPSKLDVMADQIAERYHQTKDVKLDDDPPGVSGLLQLVFLNQGVPKSGDPNTYGRLRTKLVERGVPAERIEFVHDHDGPRKRPKLYGGARRANPNVLIGSFAKMGYGTNVQTRLSDIHIGDVEWNPADLIQAIKRGHRQGNRLSKVTVRYYPVEFSIDARMFAMNWQRLVVQEMALDRDYQGTVSGEAGEFSASQLGSLSAIASGNPRLQELEDLTHKLEDLEDDAANHESMRKRSRDRIDNNARRASALKIDHSHALALAQVVTDHVDTAVYAGTSTTPLSEAQVAQTLNTATRAAINRDAGSEAIRLTYRGLKVRVEWAPARDEFDAYAVVHTDTAAHRVGLDQKWTRKGQHYRLARAVLGAIDHLPELPEQISTQIARLEHDSDSTRAILDAPFERAAELEALRTEVVVLEEELAREQEDLAERVQRAEALALDEVAPLLAPDGTQTFVGWEPSGQMALQVHTDHKRLLRPPHGWSEQAAPGRTRLGRAIHGSHWVLTRESAPFDSPLDYTAHLASTPTGTVLARIYVTSHNRRTGQDTATVLRLSEQHPTYGEALAAVRTYLLRELPKLHTPRANPARLVGPQVWDHDIERLARHTPMTVLHAGAAEAGLDLPTTHAVSLAPVALEDLKGRYALIRMTGGHVMAHTIGDVDLPDNLWVGNKLLTLEMVAEAISLDPHHPARYLRPGHEPALSPDALWRAGLHPGDPLSPTSRSLRRNVHSVSGLAAQGREVECVIDRHDLGHAVPEAERFVTVHATVHDTDDSHLRLHLPIPEREMGAHSPSDYVTPHVLEYAPNGGKSTKEQESTLLRVPMSAVVSVQVDNTTRRWERQVQQAALARPEPKKPREPVEETAPEQAQAPRGEHDQESRLTPEQVHARAFEALDAALAEQEGLRQPLSEAAQGLLSPDRSRQVDGYLGVAQILVRAQAEDLPGFGEQRALAHHLALALADEGEHAAAVQVRHAFSRPSDEQDWRSLTARDAHQWALAQEGPLDRQSRTLLSTDPQAWDTSESGLDHVRGLIEAAQLRGHHHNAAVLIDKAKEAFIDQVTSLDWSWKSLERRYNTVAAAAAHTHAAAIEHPAGQPQPLPFPHGLGLLIGRRVALLRTNGEVQLAEVRDFDQRHFLVTDQGSVFQNDLAQVRTTDNRYMALASGEPQQLEEALGHLARQVADERAAFTHPFREGLADWIGTTVQVHTPRTVLADGVLEEIAPTGLRVRASGAKAPHTVRFEVVDSLTSQGRPRWWASPAHNAVAQHLAATERFLQAGDYPTARRHLDHAWRVWTKLEPSGPRQRQEIEDSFASVRERAQAPLTPAGAPLVQIERSGPQGRTVRVFGIERPDKTISEVLQGLVHAEPPLLFSEQDHAYVPNATWRERSIDARLEQLCEDLDAAGIAYQTATVDYPEPELPLHPPQAAAEPVQAATEDAETAPGHTTSAPTQDTPPKRERPVRGTPVAPPAAAAEPGPAPSEAASEPAPGFDRLVRAVVDDMEAFKLYVPVNAPPQWREIITRNGLSFDDAAAPWAFAFGESTFKQALRGIREDFSQLSEPPLLLNSQAWQRRMRAVLGAEVSEERQRQVRDVDQHRAHSRIQELISEGDVRAAYTVMAEHTTALRQAGLISGWVMDPERGVADLYLTVSQASRNNADTIIDHVRGQDAWSAQEVAELAEQVHRQCPHLAEEEAAEILPEPSPDIQEPPVAAGAEESAAEHAPQAPSAAAPEPPAAASDHQDADVPPEDVRVTRARQALQAMEEDPGLQTLAKAHDHMRAVADEVEDGYIDRAIALELFAEYARIRPDMASTIEAERSRVALPTTQAPGFAEALIITHTPHKVQIRTPQPLPEPVHELLLKHGFATDDHAHYAPPQDWSNSQRKSHLGQLLHALNTLPEAPERMSAEHHERTSTRAATAPDELPLHPPSATPASAEPAPESPATNPAEAATDLARQDGDLIGRLSRSRTERDAGTKPSVLHQDMAEQVRVAIRSRLDQREWGPAWRLLVGARLADPHAVASLTPGNERDPHHQALTEMAWHLIPPGAQDTDQARAALTRAELFEHLPADQVTGSLIGAAVEALRDCGLWQRADQVLGQARDQGFDAEEVERLRQQLRQDAAAEFFEGNHANTAAELGLPLVPHLVDQARLRIAPSRVREREPKERAADVMNSGSSARLTSALYELWTHGYDEAALSLITEANLVDPRRAWDREPLRSRMLYTTDEPPVSVRVRIEHTAAATRVHGVPPEPGGPLRTALRQATFTPGPGASWSLAPRTSYPVRTLRAGQLIHLLETEAIAHIDEARWQALRRDAHTTRENDAQLRRRLARIQGRVHELWDQGQHREAHDHLREQTTQLRMDLKPANHKEMFGLGDTAGMIKAEGKALTPQALARYQEAKAAGATPSALLGLVEAWPASTKADDTAWGRLADRLRQAVMEGDHPMRPALAQPEQAQEQDSQEAEAPAVENAAPTVPAEDHPSPVQEPEQQELFSVDPVPRQPGQERPVPASPAAQEPTRHQELAESAFVLLEGFARQDQGLATDLTRATTLLTSPVDEDIVEGYRALAGVLASAARSEGEHEPLRELVDEVASNLSGMGEYGHAVLARQPYADHVEAGPRGVWKDAFREDARQWALTAPEPEGALPSEANALLRTPSRDWPESEEWFDRMDDTVRTLLGERRYRAAAQIMQSAASAPRHHARGYEWRSLQGDFTEVAVGAAHAHAARQGWSGTGPFPLPAPHALASLYRHEVAILLRDGSTRVTRIEEVPRPYGGKYIATFVSDDGDLNFNFGYFRQARTTDNQLMLLSEGAPSDMDAFMADLHEQRAHQPEPGPDVPQESARTASTTQNDPDPAPAAASDEAAEILPEPSPAPQENPHFARAVQALDEYREREHPEQGSSRSRRSIRRHLDAVVQEVLGGRVDRQVALELFTDYARIHPPAAVEVERARARVALPSVDTPGFAEALIIRAQFSDIVVHTPQNLDERVHQALIEHGFVATEPGRYEPARRQEDLLGRFLHTLNQIPGAPERMPVEHHDRLTLGPAGARRVDRLPADPLPEKELHTAVVVDADHRRIFLPPGAPQAWRDILISHDMRVGIRNNLDADYIIHRDRQAFTAAAQTIAADLRAADPSARVMDLPDWQAHHRALVGDEAFEARHDALEVAQVRALDDLHHYLGRGDVLAAEAVAAEHQSALWRAGLVYARTSWDPEHGLVDLMGQVADRAVRNRDALLQEISQIQAWDEALVARMAERLGRESPFIAEWQLAKLPAVLREELARVQGRTEQPTTPPVTRTPEGGTAESVQTTTTTDWLLWARVAVADMEAAAAGAWAAQGQGTAHARLALVTALEALRDVPVEHEQANELFVRANRADPEGAWEREHIRSRVLYPAHAHDQGNPVCVLDPHAEGEHFNTPLSLSELPEALEAQLKKLGFAAPKGPGTARGGVRVLPVRWTEETREQRVSALIAFADEHGIAVITRAQHQERQQARAGALAQAVAALEEGHLGRLSPVQAAFLQLARGHLAKGSVESAEQTMSQPEMTTGPGSDIIREVTGPFLSPSTTGPAQQAPHEETEAPTPPARDRTQPAEADLPQEEKPVSSVPGTPGEHRTADPETDPVQRATAIIHSEGPYADASRAERWKALDQALTDLSAQGRHQEVLDSVARVRSVNLLDWWRWEAHRSRAAAALDPAMVDRALRLHYARDGEKAQTHLYGVTREDKALHKALKAKPLNLNNKVSENRWQVNPSWGWDKHAARVRALITLLEERGIPYLSQQVHAELLEERRRAEQSPAPAPEEAATAEQGAVREQARPAPAPDPAPGQAAQEPAPTPETAAPAAAPEPITVTAQGHLGQVNDVLKVPKATVAVVSEFTYRSGPRAGEPGWRVVYDLGGGREVLQWHTERPEVRKNQTITDFVAKVRRHTWYDPGRGRPRQARTEVLVAPPRAKAFPLTDEQAAIIEHALAGKILVVQAGAGTGKTSTSVRLAEALTAQGRHGAYLVYGRANADEAALKMAHVPVMTDTLHALARAAVGGPYNDRLDPKKAPRPDPLASMQALGVEGVELSGGTYVGARTLYGILDKALREFEKSADTSIGAEHIVLPGYSPEDLRRVRRVLAPVLERSWQDIVDPAGHLFRFTHDSYVKLFHLSGARIEVGGAGRGFVIIDEAQDMNKVAEAILRSQTHLQLIWVGDSAQAVHAWRGAIDALERQTPDETLTLSRSFRFGEDIAEHANGYLEALDSPLRLQGNPAITSVVQTEPLENPDMVLCRTNAGVFTEATVQLDRGRTVGIIGGTKDLLNLVQAAEELRNDGYTEHPDLSHFATWQQVVDVARDTPEDLDQLAPFVRVIDTRGTSVVRDYLARMSDSDPDVWLSTAHRSKGLEADNVQIGDDFKFKSETDEGVSAADVAAERRLKYVAVTRAKETIALGSLAGDPDLATDTAQPQAQAQQENNADLPETSLDLDGQLPAGDQDAAAVAPEQAPAPVPEAGSETGTPTAQVLAPAPEADAEPIQLIPLDGPIEDTEQINALRQVARDLPEDLRHAITRPRVSMMGPGHGPGLDWSTTPAEHLQGLRERHLLIDVEGVPHLTQEGYRVGRLLQRMLDGPDTHLLDAAPSRALASGAALSVPAAEEQQNPADRAPEPEPQAPTAQPAAPEPGSQDSTPRDHQPQEAVAGDPAPQPEPTVAAADQEQIPPVPESEPPTPVRDRAPVEASVTLDPDAVPAQVQRPPGWGSAALNATTATPEQQERLRRYLEEDDGHSHRQIQALSQDLADHMAAGRWDAFSALHQALTATAQEPLLHLWQAHGESAQRALDATGEIIDAPSQPWENYARTLTRGGAQQDREQARDGLHALVHTEYLQNLIEHTVTEPAWNHRHLGRSLLDLAAHDPVRAGAAASIAELAGTLSQEEANSIIDAAEDVRAANPPQPAPEERPGADEQEQGMDDYDAMADAPEQQPEPPPTPAAEPEPGPARAAEPSVQERQNWPPSRVPDVARLPLRSELNRPGGWVDMALGGESLANAADNRAAAYQQGPPEGAQRRELVRALSQDLVDHMSRGRWDAFASTAQGLLASAPETERPLWYAHMVTAQAALDRVHAMIVAGTHGDEATATWARYAHALTIEGPSRHPQAQEGLHALVYNDYLAALPAHAEVGHAWMKQHLYSSLRRLAPHHPALAAQRAEANPHQVWEPEQAQELARTFAAVPALAPVPTAQRPAVQEPARQEPPVREENAARRPADEPAAAPRPSGRKRSSEGDAPGNTEANRARIANGVGAFTGERRRLHIELPEGAQDAPAQDENKRQLRVTLPEGERPRAQSTPVQAQPPQRESAGPQQEGARQGVREEAPQSLAAGPQGVRIDGRELRAQDKRWGSLLRDQGLRKARGVVDHDVYNKMRKQLRQALDNDTDVHLVMPTNDLARVREFINLAREYGYEITVAARIAPNPVRGLDAVEQLYDQLKDGHPERALPIPDTIKEHQNLREIVETVHNEHLADRVELYPRAGVTTDTTAVVRDHLIGDEHNPRWSLGTSMKEQIDRLEKASLTDPERERLRTRTSEIFSSLPPDHEVQDHLRWAHDQVKGGVGYLKRTNGERQPGRERRTTISAGEGAHPEHGRPRPRDEHEPPHEEEPPPSEDHAHGYGERVPAMAGAPAAAPPHEAAAASARPKRKLPRTANPAGPGRPPGQGPAHTSTATHQKGPRPGAG